MMIMENFFVSEVCMNVAVVSSIHFLSPVLYTVTVTRRFPLNTISS
jgi:hypothetical protein